MAWKLAGNGRPGPDTIHLGHELLAFTKTQMPCMIMPENRWTSTRYPDWESEDVSDKRDMEPQQCAYHDMISLSSACTAPGLGSLLVYGLVLPKIWFHLTKRREVNLIRSAPSGCLL